MADGQRKLFFVLSHSFEGVGWDELEVVVAVEGPGNDGSIGEETTHLPERRKKMKVNQVK